MRAARGRLGSWCVLTLPLWLGSCGSGASDAATPAVRPPTPIHVETIEPQAFEETLVVPGIVEARSRTALGFRIPGFIADLAVSEGDRVEANAIIAVLDQADLERDVRMARVVLEEAEARAAEAKLLFERQTDLVAGSSVSQQAYDRARLAWEAARAGRANAALQLEAAKDRLAKGVLRAPVSGYIEQCLVEPHEQAAAGQPVVVLTELDTVTVRAAVADTAITQLRPGGVARVRSAAWPDETFAGTISRIHVTADPTTRTCPFEVSVPNPRVALLPELAVDVELATGRSAERYAVPLAAVLHDAAMQPFCFVVRDRPDGLQAVRRPVTLGPVHGARVTIAAGLSTGDRVVTRGQHFLGEGDPVRIVAN